MEREELGMMKLKKIDGGMYCFLLTFDPTTEMVNIVDLQANTNSIGSLPAQSAKTEILSPNNMNDQKPEAETFNQKKSMEASSKPVAVAHPKMRSEEKVAAPVEKVKVIEQVPKMSKEVKPAREYRPHELLSRREAGAYLGVSEQTLAIWKCTGRYNLPYLKIGRLVKYKVADLDAFLDRVKHDPETPQMKSKLPTRPTYANNRKLEF